MRPVCVKCAIEYKVERNDITVEVIADFGSYQLWSGDMWKCPRCGHLMIAGFGLGPMAHHWQPDYADFINRAPDRVKVTES